jgi:hypothetical protein
MKQINGGNLFVVSVSHGMACHGSTPQHDEDLRKG